MTSSRVAFSNWLNTIAQHSHTTHQHTMRLAARPFSRTVQRSRPVRPSRRYASNRSTNPSNTGHRAMSESNPFYIPKPDPSQFPPISQRLKPLIPFMIYWTALTSLAYNLLRLRTLKEEESARRNAQISVLEGLVNRYRAALGMKTGTELDNQEVAWPDEAEVERELQMVGLRERNHARDGAAESSDFQEGRDVGWKEVLFGRKRAKLTEEEEEKAAAKEWRDGKQTFYGIFRMSLTVPLH